MCDLILFNANVITMDPAKAGAELIAISGNQIAAVGDNSLLRRLKQPKTRIIDCGKRTLLPGFIDAHCHLHAYAESLVSLDLSPRAHVRSLIDIQSRIRDVSGSRPPGTWIRGKGYNEFYLAEERHPNRRDLDSAAPHHPIKLTHRSGHAHILNSLALELAGITAETGDPPEGFIDREPETGMPTGILYGMGKYLARRIPPLDAAEIERGLILANEKLLSYGITSIHDASSANDLGMWSLFEGWKARGILQPRLTAAVGLKSFREFKQILHEPRTGDFGPWPAAVKIIAGEVAGSLYPTREELNEQISAINTAGLQAMVHAVEEPVIEAVCDSISHALEQQPREDHRHRIEHCSVCPPSLIRRLAKLGIMVVTQPSFIYYNGDRYLKTVPGDQLEMLYPIGSMLKSGLRVGFSSDFPVSDPNPLVGICAAVTRMTETGSRVLPDEGISLPEALERYTMGSASASFQESVKGSLAPGKAADIIMLDEDPFRIEAACIKDIRVLMTIVGGRIVWERRCLPPCSI
jgi:predicted amidohydrolase YtcJ